VKPDSEVFYDPEVFYEVFSTEEESIDLIKIEIRHYAKKQMTWFKNKIKNIEWIDLDEYDEDEVTSKIIARIMEKS